MAIVCFKSAVIIYTIVEFGTNNQSLVQNKKLISVLVITFPVKKIVMILHKVLSLEIFLVKNLPLIMYENIL